MQSISTNKWPINLSRYDPLYQLYNRRSPITIYNDILLFSDRIIVPKTLQNQVLSELHNGHPGITRMKRIARSYVYWPGIDNDITSVVQNCQSCLKTSRNPVKIPTQPWPKAQHPMDRIHVDYAGPLDGKIF